MELINWSLNAIDTIFSTRKSGSGEPECPHGTHPAGYMHDSWGSWRPVCLAPLSSEDVEDLYIFGFMLTGFVPLAMGASLIYQRIGKAADNVIAKTGSPQLSVMINEVGKAVQSQTVLNIELRRKVDDILGKLTALNTKMNA